MDKDIPEGEMHLIDNNQEKIEENQKKLDEIKPLLEEYARSNPQLTPGFSNVHDQYSGNFPAAEGGQGNRIRSKEVIAIAIVNHLR